jgi:hypothetical protein
LCDLPADRGRLCPERWGEGWRFEFVRRILGAQRKRNASLTQKAGQLVLDRFSHPVTIPRFEAVQNQLLDVEFDLLRIGENFARKFVIPSGVEGSCGGS